MRARTQAHTREDAGCLLPGMVPYPETLEDIRTNAKLAADHSRIAYAICREVSDGSLLYALWVDAGYGEHVGEWEILETVEPSEWNA